MNEQQLIIDNDAFVLLAAAGQLDTCIALLGFTAAQTLRLSALPYMLAGSLKGKGKAFQKFTADHRKQAVSEAARFEGIKDRPADDELTQLLAPAINFDAGLYATVAESSAVWLNSGDVAAMRRVCGSAEFERVAMAMRGRVISLESLANRFIDVCGYDTAANAFGPVLYANKTLSLTFPKSGNLADPLESARSHLRSLCLSLGRGFLHCPPCPDFHTSGVCKLETQP